LGDYKQLYSDVSHEKKDPYFKFRDSHPEKQLSYSQHIWPYRVCEKEGDTVLLLPGGTGEGLGFFRVIEELNKEFNIITISYPFVKTIDQLLDGIQAVMNSEKVTSAHIIGASAGGHIAQCLAKRNPERVKKLVLTNTFVPDADYVAKAKKNPVLVRLLPRWLITRVGLNSWKKIAKKTVPADEYPFLEAYVREIYTYTDVKDQVLFWNQIYESLVQNYTFKPGDLKNLGILIIEGALDDAVGAERRKNLKKLYPNAKSYTFKESGHEIVFVKPKEYVEIVTNFINYDKVI